MHAFDLTNLNLYQAMCAVIDQLDFFDIVDKMSDEKYFLPYWDKAEAWVCCQKYKNYLKLQCKVKCFNQQFADYPPLVPSEEVDEFWHNHILDTKKYFKDCELFFGEYLHHDPSFGRSDNPETKKKLIDAFDKTQELYLEEFGEYM
jgi:hypothetical protein